MEAVIVGIIGGLVVMGIFIYFGTKLNKKSM